MSKRHRLAVAAFAGLYVLCCFGSAAAWARHHASALRDHAATSNMMVVNEAATSTTNQDTPKGCPGAYDPSKSCDALTVNAAHDQSKSAFFALIIGSLTLVAAGLAAIFAGLAARYTRKSAEAAEKTLKEVERPIVYVFVSEPGLKVENGALIKSTLRIVVANFGRMPALIKRLEYTISPAPHGKIVEPIRPSDIGGRELPVGTVSITGDPFGESTNLYFEFIDDQADIVAGKKSIWVTGFVRYDDVMGVSRINGFALVFDRVSGRFVRRGGDKYNYEREEKAREIPKPSSDS